MTKTITFIVYSLLYTCAFAQNAITFNGAIGRENAGNKYLAFGYKITPFEKIPWLKLQANAGLLTITELSKGRCYFVNISPTLDVKIPAGLYGRVSHGIGYISDHNEYLDSNFQVFTKLAAGFYTDTLEIGVFYQHISSGANSKGNLGMDFNGIEVGLNL